MHPRHREPQYTRVPFRLPVSGSGSDFYARTLHVGQASRENQESESQSQGRELANDSSESEKSVERKRGGWKGRKVYGERSERRISDVTSAKPKITTYHLSGEKSLSHFISQFPGFLILSRIKLKCELKWHIFYFTEVYYL